MTWADLCSRGGKVKSGKKIDLSTLWGFGVNHDLRGKTGMPDASALRTMANLAQGLTLKDKNKKGIAFNIQACSLEGENLRTQLIFNDFVGEKTGAGVCYENSLLPSSDKLQPVPDLAHLVIHQSLAPCSRCRAGYSAWAVSRMCTILIASDDEYDQAPANSTFVFAPTGLVFHGVIGKK